MLKLMTFLFFCLVSAPAEAQQFAFSPPSAGDERALSRHLAHLANDVLRAYQDDEARIYLDNRFRLQLVAGRYSEAAKTLVTLRGLPPPVYVPAALAPALNVQYEILAVARMRVSPGLSFEEAFRQAFRERMGSLDNRTSALVIRAFSPLALVDIEQRLRDSLDRLKGKNVISLADALELVRAYNNEQAYRQFASLAPPLITEDDARRYIITADVSVRIPNGATICTLIVRPRNVSARLPALLHYTVYNDPPQLLGEARRTASNDYVGVVGLTRGKGCSPDKPVLYRNDGADAAALIDWIAQQSWSDGRVGMFGGSQPGFTTWAVTKYMPKALKAIMAGAPVAPGLDVPMEGNVFWNFIYQWPFYTANNKYLDDAVYNDNERWNRLYREWYVKGFAYRDLPKFEGTPNPLWSEWISHPSYDAFWKATVPQGKEFARINIPVLSTAGYYFGGPGAAVHYFAEHQKYRPSAEHYLVVGPYDHLRGHRGTLNAFGELWPGLGGYALDPVAHIDLGNLRYQWFDYVLKGGQKPILLQDKVNYQLMGANTWKHAPSLQAMSKEKLRFYLSPARAGEAYRLARETAPNTSVILRVDLADRTDVDRVGPGGGVLDTVIDPWNGLAFISDPLQAPREVSGLFSGRLSFVANKRDFDFQIQLYELTPEGKYLQLAPYQSRASYVANLSRRRLLTAGKRQSLDFSSIRLMSRQFRTGSRLVAVLSVIKSSGQQINYGTGKDVSDETIADAGEPLSIRWFGDSFIDVPVS